MVHEDLLLYSLQMSPAKFVVPFSPAHSPKSSTAGAEQRLTTQQIKQKQPQKDRPLLHGSSRAEFFPALKCLAVVPSPHEYLQTFVPAPRCNSVLSVSILLYNVLSHRSSSIVLYPNAHFVAEFTVVC